MPMQPSGDPERALRRRPPAAAGAQINGAGAPPDRGRLAEQLQPCPPSAAHPQRPVAFDRQPRTLHHARGRYRLTRLLLPDVLMIDVRGVATGSAHHLIDDRVTVRGGNRVVTRAAVDPVRDP